MPSTCARVSVSDRRVRSRRAPTILAPGHGGTTRRRWARSGSSRAAALRSHHSSAIARRATANGFARSSVPISPSTLRLSSPSSHELERVEHVGVARTERLLSAPPERAREPVSEIPRRATSSAPRRNYLVRGCHALADEAVDLRALGMRHVVGREGPRRRDATVQGARLRDRRDDQVANAPRRPPHPRRVVQVRIPAAAVHAVVVDRHAQRLRCGERTP